MNKTNSTRTLLALFILFAVSKADAQKICMTPAELGKVIAGACEDQDGTSSGESDGLPADLFDLPSADDLPSPLASDLFNLIVAQYESDLRQHWAGCSKTPTDGWSLPAPYCYRVYLPRQLFHAVETNSDAVASGADWSKVADAAFLAELHQQMKSRSPRVVSVPDGQGGKVLVIRSSSRRITAAVDWLEESGELAALDLKSYFSPAELSGSFESTTLEPRPEVAKQWRRAEKQLTTLLGLYDSEAIAGLHAAAEVLRDVADSTESEQDDELALLLESLLQDKR